MKLKVFFENIEKGRKKEKKREGGQQREKRRKFWL